MEMEDQNLQLEGLVAKAAANNRKAFRRSMIFSVLALLAGALWLFYSFNQVKKFEMKSSELALEINRKTEELITKEKQLDEARAALLAINPLLERYGVLKEKLTANDINSNLVKQSLDANREIQNISSTNVGRRGDYTVVYFLKDVDAGKVEAALKEFGFHPKTSPPQRPDVPTNLIAFGTKVNPEDAKLVAYTLVRAGVDIKGMCKMLSSARASIIQVLGDDRLLNRSAMTVDQIRDKTEFQPCTENTMPWPEKK
jgi:hypothetical protein